MNELILGRKCQYVVIIEKGIPNIMDDERRTYDR